MRIYLILKNPINGENSSNNRCKCKKGTNQPKTQLVASVWLARGLPQIARVAPSGRFIMDGMVGSTVTVVSQRRELCYLEQAIMEANRSKQRAFGAGTGCGMASISALARKEQELTATLQQLAHPHATLGRVAHRTVGCGYR